MSALTFCRVFSQLSDCTTDVNVFSVLVNYSTTGTLVLMLS